MHGWETLTEDGRSLDSSNPTVAPAFISTIYAAEGNYVDALKA
jgi:hypothetical protein